MATAKKVTDAEDRDWRIKVTTHAIEKVREDIEIDIGDITGETMKRLAMDDVLLVRTLWVICEDQADKAKISTIQFGEGFVGDCLDDAYEALRGALEDFFPSTKRNFFKKMMQASREMQATAMETGLAALTNKENREKMTDAMKERIKAELEKELTRLRSVTD